MSYSLDLRERVVLYIESGGSRISASKLFNICERTVRRWLSLKSESGSLSPREHGGGYPPKINLCLLKQSIDSDVNKTLDDLAEEFAVSRISIWAALKRINYVYKKNSSLQRKRYEKEI